MVKVVNIELQNCHLYFMKHETLAGTVPWQSVARKSGQNSGCGSVMHTALALSFVGRSPLRVRTRLQAPNPSSAAVLLRITLRTCR